MGPLCAAPCNDNAAILKMLIICINSRPDVNSNGAVNTSSGDSTATASVHIVIYSTPVPLLLFAAILWYLSAALLQHGIIALACEATLLRCLISVVIRCIALPPFHPCAYHDSWAYFFDYQSD